MSVFTGLPQDMLQHEIARFLTHKDALAWNEVLKKDERVYKKLPKDYAIKHQFKISHASYHSIAPALLFSLSRIQDGFAAPNALKAFRLLKKLFAWFKDPKNHVVLMHTTGRKEGFLENIGQWTEGDLELYEHISSVKVDELRAEAREVVALVSEVPFIRHVSLAGHKNAFAA
jgi:phytoene dehydrogenase-like protein